MKLRTHAIAADALAVAGLGILLYGIALIYAPAAWIAGGLALLLAATRLEMGRAHHGTGGIIALDESDRT